MFFEHVGVHLNGKHLPIVLEPRKNTLDVIYDCKGVPSYPRHAHAFLMDLAAPKEGRQDGKTGWASPRLAVSFETHLYCARPSLHFGQ